VSTVNTATVRGSTLFEPSGALYKTLHDARRKLRRHLQDQGLALDSWLEQTN